MATVERRTIQRDCGSNEIHEPHDYRVIGCNCHCDGYDGHCRNCHGRQCMACLLSETHEQCQEDCPSCTTQPLRDWGREMHDAAERHLLAVIAADAEEEEEGPEVAPFCGCETCTVREVLAGAWPVIEEYGEHMRSLK